MRFGVLIDSLLFQEQESGTPDLTLNNSLGCQGSTVDGKNSYEQKKAFGANSSGIVAGRKGSCNQPITEPPEEGYKPEATPGSDPALVRIKALRKPLTCGVVVENALGRIVCRSGIEGACETEPHNENAQSPQDPQHQPSTGELTASLGMNP